MGVKGMKQPRRLTDEMARELVRLYDLHQRTAPKRLAAQFGVSLASVKNYVNRARGNCV